MSNVIDLVTKYLPVLDEQYRLESKSAILDTPMEFIQQTKEAKKFKVAKLDTDALADYSRNGGFETGSANLSWEEHEYTIDRGRALQVDVMDNTETFKLAFGRLAGVFQKDHVIPEMDAIRFAKYYQYAGTKKALALTTSNVLSVIDDLDAEMDDYEVPEEGRIVFCNPLTYKLIVNDTNITRYLTVNESLSKALNKKIYEYNNHPIIKVPSGRFYTEITLLDGKTAGQVAGGYIQKPGASVIGLLLIQKDAVIQSAKRVISRFWAPTREEMDMNKADGVNPNADAWKFDYRNYHDAWVLDNKLHGIAAVVNEGVVTTVAGSYNVSTQTWTDGSSDYALSVSGVGNLNYSVSGTIPYAAAEASIGLGAGNRFQIKIKNPNIASQSALPSGNIAKIYGTADSASEPRYVTKSAFESDGSLIAVVNAKKSKVFTLEIEWTTGVVSTYKYDLSKCVFPTE